MPHECDECGQSLKSRQGLLGHKRIVHTEGYKPPIPPVSQGDVAQLTKSINDGFALLGGELEKLVEANWWDSGRTNGLSQETTDRLATTVAAKVMQDLNYRHRPGLCTDDGCQLCIDSKKKLTASIIAHNTAQVRQAIFEKLNQASRDEDLIDEANRLAERFLAIERGEPPVPFIYIGDTRFTDSSGRYISAA